MEQENKYYTPDISELHIGYECQIGNLFALPGSRWEWAETKPLKWSTIAFIAQAMIPEHLVYIRTKYLDQSDIESCGWKWFTNSSSGEEYEISSNDKTYSLIQVDYSHNIYVFVEDGYGDKTLFYGECKSINELRKIMQWLNIK